MKDIKLRLYYNEIFTYTNVFKYVKIEDVYKRQPMLVPTIVVKILFTELIL